MKSTWPARLRGVGSGLLALCFITVGLPGLSLAASLPVQRATPMSVAHQVPVGNDILQFRLADSSFAPALIDPFADGRLSDLTVDVPSQNPFYANHSDPYTGTASGQDLHRLDGYRQMATWGAVEIAYEVSTFPNAGWALNAMRDGMYTTGGKGGLTPEDCPTINGHPCQEVPYPLGFTSTNCSGSGSSSNCSSGSSVATGSGLYVADQFNSCLVEVKAAGPSAANDTMMSILQSVLRAADGTMRRLCADDPPADPPALDFNVIVARVEPAGSAPDFQLQNNALRIVHVGHTVDLSLYFSVTDAPSKCTAIGEFTVEHGSGVLFYGRSKAMKVGTGPNTYRIVESFTPRTAGHDTIVARVSIDGIQQQWKTAVTVKR